MKKRHIYLLQATNKKGTIRSNPRYFFIFPTRLIPRQNRAVAPNDSARTFRKGVRNQDLLLNSQAVKIWLAIKPKTTMKTIGFVITLLIVFKISLHFPICLSLFFEFLSSSNISRPIGLSNAMETGMRRYMYCRYSGCIAWNSASTVIQK